MNAPQPFEQGATREAGNQHSEVLMDQQKMQAAYERLAFMHTSTMAELVRTQQQMDCMSKSWWRMLKYLIKRKLGFIEDYE